MKTSTNDKYHHLPSAIERILIDERKVIFIESNRSHETSGDQTYSHYKTTMAFHDKDTHRIRQDFAKNSAYQLQSLDYNPEEHSLVIVTKNKQSTDHLYRFWDADTKTHGENRDEKYKEAIPMDKTKETDNLSKNEKFSVPTHQSLAQREIEDMKACEKESYDDSPRSDETLCP